MRYLIFLVSFLLFFKPSLADQWDEQRYFEGADGSETLRVISTTDTAVFSPIINRFLALNNSLNVEYVVAGSAAIYESIKADPDRFDLVISSAMDLQLKLVNDGYAYRTENLTHPDWAQWRQSLFGFTLEPASIVINRQAFENIDIPESRQDMIEVLRSNAEMFRGRIGTYDIRQSGLGYLFATQDARTSETYWRLMEIMGSLDTQLYCCSGDMLEDLANGDIAIAYNVLGSYASARSELKDTIAVILPIDYTSTMMRTVLITKDTPRSTAAIEFLSYLISESWVSGDGYDNALPSLKKGSENADLSIISLDPGLMIFLDRLKRKTFLKEWEDAVIQ